MKPSPNASDINPKALPLVSFLPCEKAHNTPNFYLNIMIKNFNIIGRNCGSFIYET